MKILILGIQLLLFKSDGFFFFYYVVFMVLNKQSYGLKWAVYYTNNDIT